MEKEMNRAVNGYNHNQCPRGFVYSSVLIENSQVYIIDSDHTLNITNKMNFEQNKVTTIQVRYLKSEQDAVKSLHINARKLAKTWENEGNKCRRKCIRGGMKRFGVTAGSGNREYFSFQPTEHNVNKVNLIHKNLNIAANRIAVASFPEAHDSIRDSMQYLRKSVPSFLGGEEGLCCELTQSQQSLLTEYHVDQDISKSLSVWSVESGQKHKPKGFYFVLPFVSCVVGGIQFHGVAVKLKHGAAIEWDGRIIFHCTVGPEEKEINAIGTFFGVTRN